MTGSPGGSGSVASTGVTRAGPAGEPFDDSLTVRGIGPGAWLLCAGVLGLALGQWVVAPIWWLTAAMVCPWALALGGKRLAHRWGWWGLLIGVVCLHGGWAGLVAHWEDDRPGIEAFVDRPGHAERGHITRVEGVVTGAVRHVPTDDGVFTEFGHRPPGTRFVMDVDRVWTAEGPVRTRGRVLVSIGGVDERLETGQRLGVRGWLMGEREAENPGEGMDGLGRFGMMGRVHVSREGNVEVLAQAVRGGGGWRDGLKARADEALMRGIDGESPAGRLTRALIIGMRDERLYEISEPYRKTGLFHLLSISGAHLSILLGLVWVLGRGVFANPASTVWLVLGVLGCYLLVLPEEVPIVRASIMVAGLCFGDLLARRLGASMGLLMSAWLILLVRPDEVTNIGFQLSYAGVMALLWLTGPVEGLIKNVMRFGRATPLMPPPPAQGVKRWLLTAGRYVRLIVAADLAAWLGTLPVLAFGFGVVNPLGWLWSLISAPVVTAVLVLGFLKMILGLVLPGLSVWLAPVVSWLAGALNTGVGWAGDVWGTSVTLGMPSGAWMVGAVAVLVALGMRRFDGMPVRLGLCLSVMAIWLGMGRVPDERQWDVPVKGARLEIGSVSVGSGSCLYARAWGEDGKAGGVLVFDAGSSSFGRVGKHRILPAFEALGIKRIDTLVISHADLDHFSGVVDLADGMPIGRVVMTRYMLEEARNKKWGTEAVLVRELEKRGIAMFLVERGESVTAGEVKGEVLWPVGGLKGWATNDLSVVMKIRSGGRTVLFCGDLQEKGIEGLEKLKENVRADIAELAHHGGVVKKSGQWLVDVSPGVVIQSSGAAKLVNDPWPELLEVTKSQRLATGRNGFVRVWVTADGRMVTERFKGEGVAGWEPEEED